MLFSSLVFLTIFLPATYFCHWLCPSIKTKNIVLLVFSLFFYAWGEPIYVLNILLTITISYYAGIWLDKTTNKYNKQLLLTLSIASILSLLFYFKYFNFVINNINTLLTTLGFSFTFSNNTVVMPIGISFFSFQAISYLVDVYRKEVASQIKYSYLALYIALFPQLIAGPIVRYKDIAWEITNRTFSSEKTYQGIIRFIQGLAKKVLIANTLGEFADEVFALESGLDFMSCWCAAICYSLQLYFDFSGYSDMAIGLGKMFGFSFHENFNYPYTSRSITEFWRRWHISLSSWFRDYVYISLGGNKVATQAGVCFNIFIVFLLTGIWHGANWTFIVWGLWHGFFVITEKVFSNFFAKLPRVISHIYTMFIVVIGWVIFRADSMADAKRFIRYMFKFRYEKIIGIDILLNQYQLFMLLLGTLISLGLFKNIDKLDSHRAYQAGNQSLAIRNYMSIGLLNTFYLAILVFTFVFLIANTFNPFIYFRF